MFVLPTLLALFTFVILRPHEIVDSLRTLPFNLIAAAVVVGYTLDLRLRLSTFRSSPLVSWAAVFFGFCTLSLVLKAGDRFGYFMPGLVASSFAFLAVSNGISSFRALETAGAVLLAITIALGAFGVHQSFSPTACYVRAPVGSGDVADGRLCAGREDCVEGGVPGAEYLCEHTGLFGTHSIGGRVRYLGLLKDPNELAWVVGMGVPLAFVLYELRRSFLRLLALLGTLAVVAICVVKTQSRSGQLTFAAVLGIYFVRRFGWRGAVGGLVAIAPVLMLGGRSGEEASGSTQERLDAWAEGLSMWRGNPIMGVGNGQFTEHHYLTAHSSLVLTLAEMGPFGLMLWLAVIYCAFKITIRVQIDLADRSEADAARVWGLGLMTLLAGLLVSAAFLSIPYHAILWTYLGLPGALYGVVRAHEPTFRVRFGWKDLALVCAGEFAIVSFIAFYVRAKGG